MLLLHLQEVDEAAWARRMKNLLGDYPVVTRNDEFDPKDVRYIFVWKPDDDAFEGLENLKSVLCLGAGVDALLTHDRLPAGIPIVRFVEDELTQCMSDYVVANVAMHHRCFSRYCSEQTLKNWTQFYPPPAWDISVGIMGLGVLGKDAALQLSSLGYQVNGWSRSTKTIEGVNSFCGSKQFDEFLAHSDILVNLLPLTPQTQGILNYENFKKLRRSNMKDGPAIINAARGGHQNEDDIIRALEDGVLGAASLDVFNVEPLPISSGLWQQKNCYITPHIAAISNPDSGASYFAKTIRDHENAMPLINVVNRENGY